jgi:hypothetical protein
MNYPKLPKQEQPEGYGPEFEQEFLKDIFVRKDSWIKVRHYQEFTYRT